MSSSAHLILEEDDLSLGNFSFGESDDGLFGLGAESSSPLIKSVSTAAPQSPGLIVLPPAKSSVGVNMSATAAAPPRMVSVESMSQVAAAPSLKKSKPTHLQSLKDLVSKKQQQHKVSTVKSSNKRSLFDSRIASIFEKPSLALQQVVEQQQQRQVQEPALKKRKIDTALHEACRRCPTVAEVDDILARDPTAAHRPATLMTNKRVYDPVKNRIQDKKVPETYRYPLNLAIQHQASPDVLERLVAAAPQVLTTPDSCQISLHILMRHKPTDQSTADMMLLKQPGQVEWVDSKGNTALHQAVVSGATDSTIRHLTILHPQALLARNWHGHTPSQLAQRSAVCSPDAVDYLWQSQQEQF